MHLFSSRCLSVCVLIATLFCSVTLSAQKTYTISSGNNYLAHRYNTTTSGYELYTTTVFSDSCVWYSPNTNNYYFMSIDGSTRYYLSAAFATRTPPNATDATDSDLGAGALLTIVAENVAVTASLGSNTSNYYFYNWDWGLAHGQQYEGYEGGSCPSEFNSVGSECWRAYWLVYDNALGGSEPRWHMSTTSSYEPLEHIATFEPVRIIRHQVTANAQTGGLSAISVGAIIFGGSISPFATIGDYSDQTTPAYTSMATGALDNCRGDWTVRVCDTIWTTHNFYPTMSYTHDHGTAEPPAVEHEYTLSDLTSSSYRWTLSGAGTAYLTLSGENTNAPTVTYSTSCYDASGSTATLTLTITWPDGSTQSATAVITIPQHLENPTAMTVAPSTMELVEGGAAGELELTFTPTEHVNTTVNSVSSETDIATASGTTVTPGSVGQTTVTVTSAVAPSVSGSVTVLVRPAAPTISYTMSNDQALVTITNHSTQCTDDQLQYKIGSGDWTNFSAAFLVNSGVEITARLLCTTCGTCGSGITSPEVKESPRVTSGVRGDYVILNDYEDHTWSYYSDPLCPIRSLNPVDVKITYHGNGTNNMTTTDNADNPTTFDDDATGVKVGIAAGEDQNTFVYYKTLERLDGGTYSYTSKNQAVGDAGYTMIPNPFQVRPVYGTGNTKYRGFYAWRVKSKSDGLTIKNAATPTTTYGVNAIIPAETKILFSTTNEYNNEVQFEALWARAYVTTTNANQNDLRANVSYERNFRIIRSAQTLTPIQTGGKNYTFTSVYPNGTTDGSTSATTANFVTLTMNANLVLGVDTKFENINITRTGGYVYPNGHDLVYGRGITTSTLTAERVNGIYDRSKNYDFTLRIESGQFGNLYFTTHGGNIQYLNSNYSFYTNVILGCDYDRATGTNDKLIVAPNGEIFFGLSGNGGLRGAVNMRAKTMDCTVKSGTYQANRTNDGAYDHSFYLGSTQESGSYSGKRYMTIEGGVLLSVAGGRGSNAEDHVNYVDTVVNIRMKGGTLNGAMLGGAGSSTSWGGRKFVITGGLIKGWLAGGCNSTSTGYGGRTYGKSYIYVGGNTTIGGASPATVNGTEGGIVFGAGRGRDTENESSIISSTVIVADNATVSRDVYGGGNYGFVLPKNIVDDGNMADIRILGGHIGRNVYGGSNMNQGQEVVITMLDGIVDGNIYGGSNTQGTINENVTINIIGGTVAGTVYGGGKGVQTRVAKDVAVTVGGTATVQTDVYGGSEEGLVNNNSAAATTATNTNVNRNTDNTTTVTVSGGQVDGNVYGGGYGLNNSFAHVAGDVTVNITGGVVKGNVFGCNNANGRPMGTVTVNMSGGVVEHNIFGGGNQAAYGRNGAGAVREPYVRMSNGLVKGSVFGGGLGTPAVIYQGTDVHIYGGAKVDGDVYGGGNAARVTGNTNVVIGN